MNDSFPFDEKYLSQVPALELLIKLGFTYLTPTEAHQNRGYKSTGLLLEEILRNQLKKLNRIQYRGREHLFSEENIQTAVQRLKAIKFDGLQRTNELVYELLTLGVSLEQSVEGDLKSFSLRYVDWNDWQNNTFHVTAELPIERNRSHDVVKPDLLLFVNGIPFAVIECKPPNVELAQGVSQMIRNQRDEYIPRLFSFIQLVIASNKNSAKYATIGTPSKFWSTWKEEFDTDKDITAVLRLQLSREDGDKLFSGPFAGTRNYLQDASSKKTREITEQDRVLFALCRPERLLDLAYKFTVFDSGVRKLARYQQFFAVLRILARVKDFDEAGRRRGGIIWHTQGSGKSLTMVMLARNLAFESGIRNPRIVLVTDRVDLDKQLGNTFAACGLSPERADSGRHLLELVSEDKAHIVTTLIHKFDKALSVRKFSDESADIFMLVDEGHRTNFGTFAARMRQMFPRACYIGFTGTPLMKREKNNFARFGGLIDAYTIDQAVKDGAVVPLLYEARHVEIEQNKKAIDLWFERQTEGLTNEQKADLKRKFSRAEVLNKADQVIYMRAFDINEHYKRNWQDTGFKAQLVAPGKVAALKYKKYLDEFGDVTSEVIISPPDLREGYDDIDGSPATEVTEFWQRMMKRYGNEEEYNKQIVSQFKYADHPEILIVVDKLLTGFDAPRNAVLYLTRILREHNLLQAIARVNRLYDDETGAQQKDFGFIVDYAGVLGELDKALTKYSALDAFDENDIKGALTSINGEVKKLPQRHADLWDIFKTIKNSHDEEAYEKLLGDDELRSRFYEAFAQFARCLGIALSSEQFVTATESSKLQSYKDDLKLFQKLRAAVKMRYAEAVDYRDYETKIQKVINAHITASEVIPLNEPVDIFDQQAVNKVMESQGKYKTRGSQADMIAHATKRSIRERMEQDPAFFEKFSKLIQQAIDDWRAQRISDLEYWKRVNDLRESIVNRKLDSLPKALRDNDDALAVYGLLRPYISEHLKNPEEIEAVTAAASTDIWQLIAANNKVGYWDDLDAQRRTINDIDDYLYDRLKLRLNVPLSVDQMDEIIDRSMRLARHRMQP